MIRHAHAWHGSVIRWLSAVWLTGAAVGLVVVDVAQVGAQEGRAVPEYFPVDSTRMYLCCVDEQVLVASLSKGSWSVRGPSGQAYDSLALRTALGAGPILSDNTLFLARAGLGDSVGMAVHRPDVRILARLRPDTIEGLIVGVDKWASLKLTWQRKVGWTKTGPVDFPSLFHLPDVVKSGAYAFGLGDVAGWGALWNEWADSTMRSPGVPRLSVYEDSSGIRRWVMAVAVPQERWAAAAELLEPRFTPMPREVRVPPEEPGLPAQSRDLLQGMLLGVLLTTLVGAVGLLIYVRRSGARRSWVTNIGGTLPVLRGSLKTVAENTETLASEIEKHLEPVMKAFSATASSLSWEDWVTRLPETVRTATLVDGFVEQLESVTAALVETIEEVGPADPVKQGSSVKKSVTADLKVDERVQLMAESLENAAERWKGALKEQRKRADTYQQESDRSAEKLRTTKEELVQANATLQGIRDRKAEVERQNAGLAGRLGCVNKAAAAVDQLQQGSRELFERLDFGFEGSTTLAYLASISLLQYIAACVPEDPRPDVQMAMLWNLHCIEKEIGQRTALRGLAELFPETPDPPIDLPCSSASLLERFYAQLLAQLKKGHRVALSPFFHVNEKGELFRQQP